MPSSDRFQEATDDCESTVDVVVLKKDIVVETCSFEVGEVSIPVGVFATDCGFCLSTEARDFCTIKQICEIIPFEIADIFKLVGA